MWSASGLALQACYSYCPTNQATVGQCTGGKANGQASLRCPCLPPVFAIWLTKLGMNAMPAAVTICLLPLSAYQLPCLQGLCRRSRGCV